jgi:hypothetical protein
MRKVADYERHAAECRKMAYRTQSTLYRRQLEDMAAAWDMLKQSRLKQLQKQGIIETADE